MGIYHNICGLSIILQVENFQEDRLYSSFSSLKQEAACGFTEVPTFDYSTDSSCGCISLTVLLRMRQPLHLSIRLYL